MAHSKTVRREVARILNQKPGTPVGAPLIALILEYGLGEVEAALGDLAREGMSETATRRWFRAGMVVEQF